MKKISVAALVCALLVVLCSCATKTDKMIEEAQTGDVITFGSYEQDGNVENGAEPIEWRVLEKGEGEILLLSEYILESMPYNEEKGKVIWEECSLRKWLNNEFISAAFSDKEKVYIKESTITNPGNSDYLIPDQKETNDRVFLPSAREIYDGIVPEEYVKAYSTDYAKEKGVEVRGQEYCMWWLRCCSVDNNNVYLEGDVFGATADDLGKAFARGRKTTLSSVGVRPMMMLAIND